MKVTAQQIKKNIFGLSFLVTMYYCGAVMFTALAPIIIVKISNNPKLVGLPASIFLLAGALAAYPAGKFMDNIGRMNIIRFGFFLGIIGNLIIRFSIPSSSLILNIIGLTVLGIAGGIIMLIRLAAIDMFEKSKQGKAMGVTLVGAVIGGILGPFIFSMLSNVNKLGEVNQIPWLIGAGIMLIGLLGSLIVYPDPLKIAKTLKKSETSNHKKLNASNQNNENPIFRIKGLLSVVFLGACCHAIMVAIMSMCGFMMSHSGHAHSSIYLAIGIHFVGMFGLMILVGFLTDKMGYNLSFITGAIIILASVIGLPFISSVISYSIDMFLLGVGWSFTFVATTVRISTLVPIEYKGRAMGFHDVLASLLGAGLSFSGGIILGSMGRQSLMISGSAIMIFLLMLFFVNQKAQKPQLSEAE